jgi:hypothetical protein
MLFGQTDLNRDTTDDMFRGFENTTDWLRPKVTKKLDVTFSLDAL